MTHTSLEKNIWFTDFIHQKLDGKNPFKMKTEYTLSGDVASQIAVGAFSFKDKDRMTSVLPGKIQMSGDKGLYHTESEITWAGCLIPGTLKLDGFSFHSKMEKISALIWEGRVLFTVGAVKAEDRNGTQAVDLSGVTGEYTLAYHKEDQVVSIDMACGMDQVRSGPEVIKDAFIRLYINGMDAQGYEDVMAVSLQALKTATKGVVLSLEAFDTIMERAEKQTVSIGFQLAGAWEKLLKKGLEVRISDLRAQLPAGNIKGDIRLRLKKDMTLIRFLPMMIQPSMAVSVFDLKSDITLPFTPAGSDQMLLSPLYPGMQTGVFIKEGETLTHTADTRDGKLFLNTKEVVLD